MTTIIIVTIQVGHLARVKKMNIQQFYYGNITMGKKVEIIYECDAEKTSRRVLCTVTHCSVETDVITRRTDRMQRENILQKHLF